MAPPATGEGKPHGGGIYSPGVADERKNVFCELRDDDGDQEQECQEKELSRIGDDLGPVSLYMLIEQKEQDQDEGGQSEERMGLGADPLAARNFRKDPR